MFAFKYIGRCCQCGMGKILVNDKNARCPVCAGKLTLVKVMPRRPPRK